MKLRKEKTKEAVPNVPEKAHLRNVGNVMLELTDKTIRFYTKKGRIRKQKEVVREIPIADIESIERVGNELSITSNGVAYAFSSEKTELVEAIYEKATEALKEQKKTIADKEAVSQTKSELSKILTVTIETVDSLFDILRSLHGQVDWNHVEGYLQSFEEKIASLSFKKLGTKDLSAAELSTAIKERQPKETAKETYNILKLLHEHFSGLSFNSGASGQLLSNSIAKKALLAYYILNDIILGATVGDSAVEEEIDALTRTLDEFSKEANLKMDVEAVKEIVNKIHTEKEKERVVEEARAVLRQQLEELTTISEEPA